MIRLFLILLTFLLMSCGEGLYEESSTVNLKQHVYVVPSWFSGDILQSLQPIFFTKVDKGQSVRFAAAYNINGELMIGDDAAKHYQSLFWEIDGEYFNLDIFRYTFNKSGIINGKLVTIDAFNDTLVTNFSVQVNTPETFTLDFPYDGYNLAEPSKAEDIPLRWTITGIDPWESAICYVYLSTNLDNVWESLIGSSDCQDLANLWGPLVGDSATIKNLGIDLTKQSYTFYWGVIYTIISDGGPRSTEKSQIYKFSTKFTNDSTALLEIPIRYLDFSDYGFQQSGPFSTVVYFVSAMGDTLETYRGSDSIQNLQVNLPPQSGIKIYFEENNRQDYTASPILVDLAPGTHTITNTVYFVDSVAPQITPLYPQFNLTPRIELAFKFYDDGAGFDFSDFQVFVDDIRTDYKMHGDSVQFTPSCSSTCAISFSGTDNAGNSLPNVIWQFHIDDKGLPILEGPFPNNGGAP